MPSSNEEDDGQLYDNLAATGAAGASAVSGAIANGQIQGANGQALGITRDAYERALALLASGQLTYDPALVSDPNPIQADPQALQAQSRALSGLEQASREGYGVQDKAAINGALDEANANERGQREAALARLDPNSGAAISAKMGAQQNSANTAHSDALKIAAASRAHALDALGKYGNQANDMRSQGDAIARFNSTMSNNNRVLNSAATNASRQDNIRNTLGGYNVLNTAGGNYAKGIKESGASQAAGTNGTGQAVGGVLAALLQAIKAGSKSNSGGSNGSDGSDTVANDYGDGTQEQVDEEIANEWGDDE